MAELKLQPALKNLAHHLLAEHITTSVFKDHAQLSIMTDILIRREHHHVLLTGSSYTKINHAWMESLALHLASAVLPKQIKHAEIIYIDVANWLSKEINYEALALDFAALKEEAIKEKKCVILAINPFPASHEFLDHFIKTILSDEHWRVILFSSQPNSLFSPISLPSPSQNELLVLLKTFRAELEEFHHVIIPDETVSSALSMATHYLPGSSRLDEALELLDSSAARASASERGDTTNQFKPIVTTTLLAQVVSCRTQIPVSHLHNNKFQSLQFTTAILRRVHGQDSALATMASVLQHACIKLQKKPGPLCSFLLVGPSDVGKTETAYAMAEHLFGHANALLHVNLNKTHYASLNEIKIISHENRCVSLLQAIRQTPYAVVLIDNINQAPAETLDFFKDIFVHGYTVDEEGNQYDFRNAIMVMTTTLGTEKISQLLQAPLAQEATKTVDLMQLVLNENLHDTSSHGQHSLSADEISEEITPLLETYFSESLLQSLHVIPFVPLDYPSLEKIVRLKLKALAKQLDAKFGIELNYAPEVIKFIAHEALWRKPHAKSLDKLLERHLYSCVAHEILAHTEDKNRPKRLMLQLNDNGQLLRCEFMTTSETGLYTL